MVLNNWEAGPRLIKYFLSGPFMDLKPSVNKIEIMLFCGDKNKGWETLRDFGIKQGQVIVEDDDDFAYFIRF